jgi:hypothetical protein
MFGKKIKKWSDYKIDLPNLFVDLNKIYADGDVISVKHSEQIVDKLIGNMNYYVLKQYASFENIIELFLKKDVLNLEIVSKLIEKHAVSIYAHLFPMKWVDSFKGNLTQQDYHFLCFKLCRSDLFDKIDDTCVITYEEIDYIFGNIHVFSYINNFKKYPKKFNDLLKRSNLQLTFSQFARIKNINTVEKFSELLSFFENNGYKCDMMSIANLFHLNNNKDIILYLETHVMPKYGIQIDENLYTHMISKNYIIQDQLLGKFLKIKSFSENNILEIMLMAPHRLVMIDEKIYELTPRIIIFASIFNVTKILKKAIETEKILECNHHHIFKYSYSNKNTDVIKFMLNNKYFPDTDTLIFIVIECNISRDTVYFKFIMSLLVQCGLRIKKEDHNIFAFDLETMISVGIDIKDDFKKYLLCHKEIDVYENSMHNKQLQVVRYLSEDERLEISFAQERVIEIIKITKKLTTLNESLFSNTVLNPNLLCFEYIRDNYNYTPSILTIMKIKNYRQRFLMLRRFHTKMID